jgi:DNA-binding XRE family transcriptional regulator
MHEQTSVTRATTGKCQSADKSDVEAYATARVNSHAVATLSGCCRVLSDHGNICSCEGERSKREVSGPSGSTADDLAFLIRVLRQASEWPQETLAELSGLTVRTIQHGEKGDPSSLDTRRALARGFGYEDLDVFNIDPVELKAQSEELERTTVARGNSRTRR